ncbi:MAG: hypothetical protein SFX72_22005 [Isosphaeraceae bacterium]|nr:hypothetical protein [Isosphaeraceae bacterium]
MSWERRVASVLLAGMGVALGSALMFMLIHDRLSAWSRVDPRSTPAADVAVFFIERSGWKRFLDGLAVATSPERSAGSIVLASDDVVIAETSPNRRRVRFSWENARGRAETIESVRRLLSSPTPPIAIIGSSNTLLTNALAETTAVASPRRAPMLLVPWATSMPLLERHRGGVVRFCANNQTVADDLVAGLATHRPLPQRVVIVVDPRDPYSLDLADCFERAVAAAAPSARVERRGDLLARPSSGRSDLGASAPSIEEQEFAREVRITAATTPTWLFLPIQGEPIRRLFAALNGAAPPRSERRGLIVVCGDGIGPAAFESFVNALTFPIWAPAGLSVTDRRGDLGTSGDSQVLAEIAAAVLAVVDDLDPIDHEAFRERLSSLKISASDPRSMGRPIAFTSAGERARESSEDLIVLEPGSSEVSYLARDGLGIWGEPRPIPGRAAIGDRRTP